MKNNDIKPNFLKIKELGFDTKINWNLSPERLEDICLSKGIAKKTNLGAIAIKTGEFTGRSPKDRFIVKDELTKDIVYWGDINQAFSKDNFNNLKEKLISHLNSKEEIYIRNCHACAEKKSKINITLISEIPWSDLFGYNMFIRPNIEELSNFKHEWTVICSPSFKASVNDGTRKQNFSIINLNSKEIIIGGTGYTGEIKKGIFSALNFILPHKQNILPMHCSANIGEENDTALFFGLSGTGKTTLSANKDRKLIGDDEHGWSEDSIFNFEGGCYAKCIDLSYEKEPDIFTAIKKGALLENISFKGDKIDFSDDSITQNTRVSYPIHHINNIAQPSIGNIPKNIFFLTADAFGVLPPISKLNSEQVMFHFVSGYTAKVAGTEEGVIEPEATFSACFGAPFMPLHPTVYAKMLVEKVEKNNVNVWLINTGWTGGPYGIGKRISLNYTRSMVNAALKGELNNVEFKEHEIFGLNIPNECSTIPSDILDPCKTWQNKDEYIKMAKKLALLFKENYNKFSL